MLIKFIYPPSFLYLYKDLVLLYNIFERTRNKIIRFIIYYT